MRSFFTLVGFATVAFVGLGWYFDWYHLTRQPANATGTQRFQVDLNGNKIADDVKKGIEEGGEIVDKLREQKSQNNPAPAQAEKPAQPDNGATEATSPTSGVKTGSN